MHAEPDIATLAATLADPARARMVCALMDGRARTATELALDGGVAASTASAHLARLLRGGLVSVVQQGRHRYFRIVDPAVAAAIEGLMGLATTTGATDGADYGPRDPALRDARVCYDHLAGTAGVALASRMVAAGYLDLHDAQASLTGNGERWLADIGIDLRAVRAPRRPACRACLDWSERRMHLAGAVGAALLAGLLRSGALIRIDGSRALLVKTPGRRFIDTLEWPAARPRGRHRAEAGDRSAIPPAAVPRPAQRASGSRASETARAGASTSRRKVSSPSK